MSIEDVSYLKNNCIKQSFTFLIDSKNRDRKKYPQPNEYVVEFMEPFKNVFSIEVVDVSIPKTMYNIDSNNNRLYYHLSQSQEENIVPIKINEEEKNVYELSFFNYIDIVPGDYVINTLIDQINSQFSLSNISLNILPVSDPPDLTNLIYFSSTYPFIINMQDSTINEVLGFDTYTSQNDIDKYKYLYYNDYIGIEKIFHSYLDETNNVNILKAPGIVYLLGYKYLLLRCPEIEQHLYRSLQYSKQNLGLAKVRINSYGYNDQQTSFFKVPIREFHPIGKLARITIRFETDTGELYNFKGVNHNIVFAIYYYEPKQEKIMDKSILNPEYKFDFINYLYKEDELDEESNEENDENDEYSRDNINIYKLRELEYNEQGIENKNKELAYKYLQANNERKENIKTLRNNIVHSDSNSEYSSDSS